MRNCYGCRHGQQMGKLMGCKGKKQIILNPNEEKDCCSKDGNKNFVDFFDMVNKDMERRKKC